MKRGALTPCLKCGYMPADIEDMAKHIIISDHYFSRPNLDEISIRVQSGQPLHFDPKQLEPFIAELKTIAKPDRKKIQLFIFRVLVVIIVSIIITILILLFSNAGVSIPIVAETYAASPEIKMNLRDMLKRDFGLELNISGGYGQSLDDPIIVLNSNPIDASMTEMHILRSIGKGRGILWRILARTPVENGQISIEQIKIETKEATESKIITQIENYYFDVSMAVVHGKRLPMVTAFSDEITKLGLPYELGWLHYNGVTDNEPTAAGFGQTIEYSAPGIKATVYIYDRKRSDIPSNIGASVVRDEFEAAVSDLMTLHPTASQLDELSTSKALLIQTFRIDSDVSVVALGVFRGKFIKLRITYIYDPILIEVVNQSIVAFQDVIAANLQQVGLKASWN